MNDDWDAIIVGSGFGGVLAAHELVRAGRRVLMLERGGPVPRGQQSADSHAVGFLTGHFSRETPYRVLAGGEGPETGAFHCVGGPSVFYGGVALRLRERDFEPDPSIVGTSGARWPFDYATLEPWYALAERVIGVAGETGHDPWEPWRSTPYPYLPAALSPTSRRIAEAARSLGLHPSRLPLALNHARLAGRRACTACPRCDGFACAIGAKNDLATAVLPELLANGLSLQSERVVVRLETNGRRVSRVVCVDRRTGESFRHAARQVIVAAGALATPHLLLASGVQERNPAGAVVGRFLTRHHNTVAMGVFPSPPEAERQFHKQVLLTDFYFGDPGVAEPRGKLGSLQQLATPPAELVKQHLPPVVGDLAARALPLVTGLLAIAEDQPRAENGVRVSWTRRDVWSLPELEVSHRYSPRDVQAGAVLVAHARRILHRAGAFATVAQPIRTFSHALGTVRMGDDPRTSPLDAFGRFRGLDNLYVSDGSALPTAAAVNPSLTIAANALRVGAHVAEQLGAGRTREPLAVALDEAVA